MDLHLKAEEGFWYVYDGEAPWSVFGYRSEWEAIDEVRGAGLVAEANELERQSMAV